MPSILFVCVENAGRSQMAEAFARIHGKQNLQCYSAGSRPAGRLHAPAIEAMREAGYDLTPHRSKALSDTPDIEYDAVVTMGCGDECPLVRARRRYDWLIPDPKGRPVEEVRAIRDTIEAEVKKLLADLEA